MTGMQITVAATAGCLAGHAILALVRAAQRKIVGDMSASEATARAFLLWGRGAFAAQFNDGEYCVGVARRDQNGVRNSLVGSGRTWRHAFANAEYIETIGKIDAGEHVEGVTTVYPIASAKLKEED